MPVKPDGTGRRSVELVFEVPGSPEEVWAALATGPGIGAWFVPSEIEEHVGGAVKFHLGGGMESSGQVTVWRPPEHVAYEEPGWSGDAPPLATEFIIEARAGGVCRVRLVHSLASDDPHWDDEIGGMEAGWTPFFEVLKIYLADFAGQPAASARPMGDVAGSPQEAWSEVSRALGLEGAKVGERRAAPAGAPELAGMVKRIGQTDRQSEVLIQLTAPAPGAALIGTFGWEGQTHVAISLYFYGPGCEATAARETDRWEAWMADRFPRAAGGGG